MSAVKIIRFGDRPPATDIATAYPIGSRDSPLAIP